MKITAQQEINQSQKISMYKYKTNFFNHDKMHEIKLRSAVHVLDHNTYKSSSHFRKTKST